MREGATWPPHSFWMGRGRIRSLGARERQAAERHKVHRLTEGNLTLHSSFRHGDQSDHGAPLSTGRTPVLSERSQLYFPVPADGRRFFMATSTFLEGSSVGQVDLRVYHIEGGLYNHFRPVGAKGE